MQILLYWNGIFACAVCVPVTLDAVSAVHFSRSGYIWHILHYQSFNIFNTDLHCYHRWNKPNLFLKSSHSFNFCSVSCSVAGRRALHRHMRQHTRHHMGWIPHQDPKPCLQVINTVLVSVTRTYSYACLVTVTPKCDHAHLDISDMLSVESQWKVPETHCKPFGGNELWAVPTSLFQVTCHV